MPSTYDIARAFVTTLNELYLSEEQMEQVRERNDAEENEGICHTHDFCDANQAMIDALKSLGVEWNAKNHMQSQLAWDIAKQCGFDSNELENYIQNFS